MKLNKRQKYWLGIAIDVVGLLSIIAIIVLVKLEEGGAL